MPVRSSFLRDLAADRRFGRRDLESAYAHKPLPSSIRAGPSARSVEAERV